MDNSINPFANWIVVYDEINTKLFFDEMANSVVVVNPLLTVPFDEC